MKDNETYIKKATQCGMSVHQFFEAIKGEPEKLRKEMIEMFYPEELDENNI